MDKHTVKRTRVARSEKEEAKRIELSEKSHMEFQPNAVECTSKEFGQFWEEQCPTEKHKVQVFGKPVECPRYQKLYGKGVKYTFSGLTLHGSEEIPELVSRCMRFAQEKYPEYPWQGALVNFYYDGTSYIGKHSDDERDLISGAPILSFSFGAKRTFRIREKATDKIKAEVETENRSMIAMCGEMQKEFTHEIPKINGKKGLAVGKRVNITVRCLKSIV